MFANIARISLKFNYFALNFDEFFRDFAKMQFRPWRLITAAIQPRFRAIPGDSGRAPVPQMTPTPQ